MKLSRSCKWRLLPKCLWVVIASAAPEQMSAKEFSALGLLDVSSDAIALLVLIGGGLGFFMSVVARKYRDKQSAAAVLFMFDYAPCRNARSCFFACGACSAFMVLGPALMMLNKRIMDNLKFRYPITLCSLGLIGASVISHGAVLCKLAQVREESLKIASGWSWLRIAFPIGAMKALTMATGNAVYLHLSFGFIQMLKAFTPLIVVLVMKLVGVKLPTRAALWSVTAIVAGTIVEVNGELHATVIGLVLMLSSEVAEAISIVLSQKILQNHKFSVLEGMYFTAPAGALCLTVAAAILEWPEMLAKDQHRTAIEHPLEFLVASLLGVGINFSSFLVMQVTSALTMKILNTARCVGLVIVGVMFYGEVHSWKQLAGYAAALLGFAGYNFFQMLPEAAHAIEHRVDRVVSRLVCCSSNITDGAAAKRCLDEEAVAPANGSENQVGLMSTEEGRFACKNLDLDKS